MIESPYVLRGPTESFVFIFAVLFCVLLRATAMRICVDFRGGEGQVAGQVEE